MDYREVIDKGQLDRRPSYDEDELQRAMDNRNEWVRVRLSRYGGYTEEPTEDFRVTIDGMPWHVIECSIGDLCDATLLQNGRNYMLYVQSLICDAWLWVQFGADATSLISEPPRGFEPFPLVNKQRACARAEMLDLWS